MAMGKPVMFLRTAQTEDRITELEKRMDALEARFSPVDHDNGPRVSDDKGTSEPAGEAVDPKGDEEVNRSGDARPDPARKGSKHLPRKSIAERVARGVA